MKFGCQRLVPFLFFFKVKIVIWKIIEKERRRIIRGLSLKKTNDCQLRRYLTRSKKYVLYRSHMYTDSYENLLTGKYLVEYPEHNKKFYYMFGFQVIIQSIKEHKCIERSKAEEMFLDWHWKKQLVTFFIFLLHGNSICCCFLFYW